MMDVKLNYIRGEIMSMLKEKFGSLSFWKRVESDIALMCAELPEPNTTEKRIEFVQKLKSFKLFLTKQDVPEEDLKFIDEEINLHEQTKIISLYEEEDDSLDKSMIAGYARLGKGSEGVVAILQDYNYSQLTKLTNGVYNETGLVKFYISQEKTVYGKIVAEIYEHPQKIPIATVIESIKINKETEKPIYKRINLFGQSYRKNEVKVIKEINLPFYVYRFITEDNNEFILMTLTSCEIGDYIVTGVETQCDDYKMLTDSAKLPTKLPFFFAQGMKNRIIQFKNHKEFKIRLEELKINKEDFFDYPFAISKGKNVWKSLHPTWYKWLIWSWLTHEDKGLMNTYPLHLMIIGVPGAGKSFLLNCLYQKSKEAREIFSGAGSTLKSLVPSFKYNPARLGYLAESNRFSFCDEFLRCLQNTRSTKEGSQREESVAIMNDLLEHQKREVGSGISRVKVNMTSRVISATNPINGINNVDDLVNRYDASFLSRWLIYYQTDDHAKLVKESNDRDLKKYKFRLPINDWVSILDYLQTFSSKYDLEKIEKIRNSVPNVFSESLNKHYDTRHKHHIECLMDGIIKTRCLMENDMSFESKEIDYKILKEVWLNIIRSWINPQQIRNVDLKERIFYLPEKSQFIYWEVCKMKRSLKKEEVEEIALKSMSKREYYEAWSILVEMGLIIEFDGRAKPYYFKNFKEDGQREL